MEPKFIHLRLHSEFSLEDGLVTIPDLIESAKKAKMPAVALTDLGNLYAVIKFYQEAIAAGIKPIIGVDVRINYSREQHQTHWLTLLCQNNHGYQNLLKLISHSFLQAQNITNPSVSIETLTDYSDGLIAISGIQSDIAQALLANNIEEAKSYIKKYQTIFTNRYYFEINRTGAPNEQIYNRLILKFAYEHHIPIVATNNVRFLMQEDFEAHEARVCIQQGITLNDPQRKRDYTDQQYFKNQQEMQLLFKDMPDALQNTVEIAKRCNVILKLGESKLPFFPVPEGFTTETLLSTMAEKGLEARLQTRFDQTDAAYPTHRQQYYARLHRELSVINEMGFAGYFQIVADFIKWAKENGVPVGPGRGSGPGSLVAYSLNITDLDPIALDLLFERFLNPERVSMPDFDIDFCIEGRDRVIQYVMDKHGHDRVSQIITYGTMAARAVVRDVGRVLALGYGFVDKIAKLIPFELGITLTKALVQEPLLQERYEQEEEVRTLIDLAKKLEGLTRNVGKHAGGIVIAPSKLTDFVPLYCELGESTHPVTQFDKDDVESVGLVKFDFLGLKTLTIIHHALQVINEIRSQSAISAIDIILIDLADKKTFTLLKACQSTAIFQLESSGMRDLIKRLQPDCFEDLIALVALFRPGPLQSGMVDDFINRKHGRANVIYPHPKLEAVLKPTYGVILYQEQVMQIAQVLAGYTLGAADILRRAMGKKKPEEMAKQREIFCHGSLITSQLSSELSNQIFDLMEKFAGYGFNKSHSAAYALIAYQTAWLKTHYPTAFMSAALSADLDKTEKITILLDECEHLKLHVSPPDINHSEYQFKLLNDTQIMYGLGAIKGVGEAAIENILAARAVKPFADLFDFCQRVDLRKVNKRVMEALIKSGSFDNFGKHRAMLMSSLQLAIQNAEQTTQDLVRGQHDLLSNHPNTQMPAYVEVSPWSDDIQLKGEKDTLGFYLTGHPLRKYLNELKHMTTCRLTELNISDHKQVSVAGIITNFRTRQTKRGDRIAIFTLDDGSSQLEIVCFSECYQKYRHYIVDEQIILVEGELGFDDFNQRPRVLARDLTTIDETRHRLAKKICISLDLNSEIKPNEFQTLLSPYRPGNCTVVIRHRQDTIQTDLILGSNWSVKPTDDLLDLVKTCAGFKAVELIY